MPDEDPLNPENRIIRLAIEGDKQAFGQLYERYVGKIYRYLFFRMDSREAAEDMTEIVFLKAWEGLPALGRKSSGVNFSAWLYRIAHNALVDHRRTKKEEIALEGIEPIPAQIEKPGTRVELDEESARIIPAMQKLDEQSQNVIISRFIGDLKPREIAEMLGLSEGNVRVIQYRALKKLQGILGDKNE